MVAVVGVMSMLASWTCQWPTKRALAVAEGTAELLGPEGLRLAVLVAGAEDVPVPDVFFEHPAAPIVATTVTTMAKASSRLIIHQEHHIDSRAEVAGCSAICRALRAGRSGVVHRPGALNPQPLPPIRK